jgi:hypothetical protein
MCSRKSASLHVDLPQKFWETLPEWKKYYLNQLSLARPLVNRYSEKSILQALKEFSYAYSLMLPNLEPRIAEIEVSKKIENEQPNLIVDENSTGKFKRPNKLGKLDD